MFSWNVFKQTLVANGFEMKPMANANTREYVSKRKECFGWAIDHKILAEERAYYDLDCPENNNCMVVFTLTILATKSGQVARKVIHVHEMMITDDVDTRELAEKLEDRFGETMFHENPRRAGFDMLDADGNVIQEDDDLDAPIGDF
jgi:hypothetical protein